MSYELTDIQLNRACYLLKKGKRILVCGHARPDGDSIGSILALKLALDSISKRVSCVISDDVPSNLWFLPGVDRIKTKTRVKKINRFDLIVSLDSNTLERTGLFGLRPQASKLKPVLNIDHHQDNSFFASVNIVKPKVSSTAEILYGLFLKLGVEITRDIATCLLCGIFFDTDAFRNPNATPRTLEITSQLLSRGAQAKKIVRYLLQEKSLPTLRLWGKVLARLKENKYGMVTTVLAEEDIKQSEAEGGDLEGIANFLNCLPQAKATLLLSEKDGTLHGNLRTQRDDVDVSKLALLFGGGGHKKAAGFTIPGRLEKTEIGWKVV